MEYLIIWGESAIADSYKDMKNLRWIPEDADVPDRNHPSFANLLATRLAITQGWGMLSAAQAECKIKEYLHNGF